MNTENPNEGEKSVEIEIEQPNKTEEPSDGSKRPLQTDEKMQMNSSSIELSIA